MPQPIVRCFWFRIFMASWTATWTVGGFVSLPIASAQVVPDGSLGIERSILRSNLASDRGLIDRIDGGAVRGSNLFHSFSEFNVNTGQRVYFANPASIDTIISRVTGRSLSNLDGTLGVLGGANLFLINPNGIAFGPNAQLDIRGSFVASTAHHIRFPNGYAFDATRPDSPPLLTVNAPIGLTQWLPTAGTLSTAGSLATGQDLTLAAETLNLQGQIRGREVSLMATETLTARDRPIAPFIASATQKLRVQGNQSVDIAALQHPGSGLFSGGDMVLRSNGSIITDTRFTAGGNFRAERLDGRLGRVISVQDPVFETGGDFSLADYTGASLQILAGGQVTIPGTITITGAGGPFNNSTVVLSNGRSLNITGTTQPTLEIRAGTTQFFGTPTGGTPTSANMTIGRIVNPGGLVFLTNQVQPNPALSGDISVGSISTATNALAGVSGGTVAIESRGKLTVTSIDASSGRYTTFFDYANVNPNNPGGDITLLAKGEIGLPFPSLIASVGSIGGNITLSSDDAIRQTNAPFATNVLTLSGIESTSFGPGQGGAVQLTAPVLALGGNVVTTTQGDGTSGAVTLTTQSLVTDQSTLSSLTFGGGNAGPVTVQANAIALGNFTTLGSSSFSASGGKSGPVTVQTGSLSATAGSQISSTAFGTGDAGDIQVRADSIALSGFAPEALSGPAFIPSAIISTVQSGAIGNSGRITINTGTLDLRQAATVATSSYGEGTAGSITVNARDAVRVDGVALVEFAPPPLSPVQPSAIQSELFTGAIGQGGDVVINTPVLTVTNGGTITASSDGDGGAGSVTINATRSALFDGVASVPGQRDRMSRSAVIAAENATGNGGTLRITTPDLKVTNGAQIAVNSQGQGTAGDVVVQARTLALQNRGLITAETTSNTGGNISLTVADVLALTGNSRISTSAGTAGAGGDGGNITIGTRFLVGQPTGNSDITANAFTGRGGRVDITAEGVFGFRVLGRAELEAALGTSDPNLLDPARLVTSDITAISRANPNLNGTVIIQSPNADPARGEVPIDPQVVDASRLIAQDCGAGGAIAQARGRFVVTGRGGLPSSPSDALTGQAPFVGWDRGGGLTQGLTQGTPIAPSLSAQVPMLVEVQALVKRSDGRVVLVANRSSPELWRSSATCQP